MPEGHAQRQFLEVVDASTTTTRTFQRLVTLRAPFRLAARPQNLLTKRDKASRLPAAVVFSPDADRVFFHRRAKHGHEDLWEVSVDEAGLLTNPSILPEPVNSPYDDVNPVGSRRNKRCTSLPTDRDPWGDSTFGGLNARNMGGATRFPFHLR